MKAKGFSCPVCCETHFKDFNLLRDTLVEVTTKIIPCPICNEKLSGLDKFTIHLFTHKNDTPQIFNENNQKQEIKIQHNNENSEILSNAAILSEENFVISENCLINNELSGNKSPIRETDPIRCDICNITFSDTNILEMHKNLLHTNGFSCHLCHKRFKMQGSLMVHMRVAHYGFGNTVRQSQDEKLDSPKGNNSTIDNKQWECEVCLKKFTTKYFLKKHKRLHTGEMPYVCTLCGKSFTFQQSYHKHMLYHSENKPHTCNECGRSFKELSTLHNHQRIHSGERPFACETCGKCFRQRVSYLVHRRIHTGAMPYRCTSCDKRFRYKVSQRTHKCKAEPPGAVVRQFGDLVQKLLQQQTSTITNNVQHENIEISVDIPEQISIIENQNGLNDEQFSTINEECLKQLLYDENNIT